jgi:hypothetical protein
VKVTPSVVMAMGVSVCVGRGIVSDPIVKPPDPRTMTVPSLTSVVGWLMIVYTVPLNPTPVPWATGEVGGVLVVWV